MSDNAKKSTDKKGNDPGVSGTKATSSTLDGKTKNGATPTTTSSENEKSKKRQDQLTALEEDDEFEEFEAEDWPIDPSAQEEIAGLKTSLDTMTGVEGGRIGGNVGQVTGEKPRPGFESLWDSTWDDDEDVGDDFSVLLKKEIESLTGTGTLVR